MKKQKNRKLSKIRYILFLLNPYWKYGRGYVLTILLMSLVLQPVSSYLTARLPQRAIDAVMNDTARNEVIYIIIFTLCLLFLCPH